MDNKNLEEVVADAIRPQLKKQFDIGVLAGYNAAIGIIYRHCKDMKTAKEIKNYLSKQLKDTHNNALESLVKNSD